jgi:hypothetical protein
MLNYGTRGVWLDVDLLWFMEITYGGSTYRFSTITMDLVDSDGVSFPYMGGLEDVVISTSLQQVGDISTQADSVSIAITFPNVNIAKNQMNGILLEGSRAVIGYVLIRNGQIQQSYDERPIVFRGQVTGPVYGHPTRDVGYVEFSIENKVFISSQGLLATILGPNMFIEDISCSNALYVPPEWPRDGQLTEVQDIHRGKVIPWVFGDLHGITQSNGQEVSIPITPAYVIAFDPSLATPAVYYLVCGHATNANTTNLFSNTGETDTSAVSSFINIDKRVLSYITILDTSTIPQSVAPNDDRQVWVEWDDGAAFPNPVGEGDLKGAGDICLWLLSELTNDLDYERWNALRPYLNQYEFAGYVNDEKITIMQWLQKEVIAHLPIHIVVGERGIMPVLDIFQAGIKVEPRLKVSEGAEFERNSPIETQNTTEDLVNNVTVRYARNGVIDDYSTFVQCSHEVPAAGELTSTTYLANPKAMVSVQRYGVKTRVVELDFVYSNLTAQRIANDIIERLALPTRTVQYSVSIRYGYLQLGDIVELTDTDLGFDSVRTQVISKLWDDSRWLIELKIDDNPLNFVRVLE